MSITLTGTIPPAAGPVVILEANPGITLAGLLKFKFAAPEAGAYVLGFCVGPSSNPCGSAASYVVNVAAGQQRLALIEASAFKSNVLVVSQGTNVAIPFLVEIE
jgi:hypothetical protein